MLIIGITGTLGAGKGTIVEYLVSQKGFVHFSVRKYLEEKIAKEGKRPDRDTLVEMANKLRKLYGPSFLAEELYKIAKKSNQNSVIESLRTPAEIISLKQKGKFFLFAVDANPKLRYERIRKRASETDKVSFKEFLANEKREMQNSDPTKQNLRKCILMADYKFDNNGTIKDLYEKVEKVISQII